MAVVAAHGFAGTFVLRENGSCALELVHSGSDRFVIRAVEGLKIDHMAHGQSQVYTDDTLLIPFRGIACKCLLIVGDCLFIIVQAILYIAHIVGYNIVLAEPEGQKSDLRNPGIIFLLIIFEKHSIYDVSQDHEKAGGRDHAADKAQEPAEKVHEFTEFITV